MKNADSIGRGNALLGPESVLGSLIDWKRNGLGNGTEYELNGGGMRVCVNGNAWVEWRDVGIWDNADLRMLGNPGLGENEKGVLGMAGGFLNAGLGNVIMGECGFNIKRTESGLWIWGTPFLTEGSVSQVALDMLLYTSL